MPQTSQRSYAAICGPRNSHPEQDYKYLYILIYFWFGRALKRMCAHVYTGPGLGPWSNRHAYFFAEKLGFPLGPKPKDFQKHPPTYRLAANTQSGLGPHLLPIQMAPERSPGGPRRA